MRKLTLLTVLAMASLSLTGCFDGSDNDDDDDAVVVVTPPIPPVPPTPETGQEDDFGAGFASAFRASQFAAPIDPVDGDIVDIDKTTDPFDIPNP